MENISIDKNTFNDFLQKDTSNIQSLTIINSSEVDLTVDNLNLLSNKLSNNGKIIVSVSNKDEASEIKSNLRFAGFTGLKINEENEKIFVSGNRKDWGESKETNQWKVVSKNENSNKINEKDLIDPNNVYDQFAKEQNCMTKPKPCKNCTCSRANENKNENEQKDGTFVKSDCGKCYLGDAFRCEGCPYRGMPAFEPGQKITLSVSDDIKGFNNNENNDVKVKEGKVKLEL